MLEESMSSTVPSSSLWASIFSWFTPTVFFVFVNLTIGTIFFTSSLASNKPSAAAAGVGEGDERNDPRLVRSPSVFQRLKSINLYSHRSEEPASYSSKIPDVGADFHFSFQQQTTQEWQQPSSPPPQMSVPCVDGSPSVFQRLKSINLYGYFSPEQKTHEINSHCTTDEEMKEPEAVEDASSGFHFSFQQQTTPRQPPSQPEEAIEETQELKEVEGKGTQGEELGFEEIPIFKTEVARTKSDVEPASGVVPTKLSKKMRKSASLQSPFSHFEEEDVVETRRPATVREGKGKATEEDEEVDAKADDFINKFKQQLKLQRMDSIIRYKETVNRGNR
ncbi:Alkaline phytoceramidase (aPHC) [Hibiscus syriacus]|uniref:Alkaline phytoceramidase (APHC) n=1 Tax=Hibiscus syriacus TaxID=106335 RepID=A0A6A2Z6I6_HIBSY|nr:pathogen-associated molecular patterns-induced protein A70-like [Hibiscus syriacus]KAE8687611.1 Alkaline phytoceramidase (aPHC) [Hibiscus syriacus]